MEFPLRFADDPFDRGRPPLPDGLGDLIEQGGVVGKQPAHCLSLGGRRRQAGYPFRLLIPIGDMTGGVHAHQDGGHGIDDILQIRAHPLHFLDGLPGFADIHAGTDIAQEFAGAGVTRHTTVQHPAILPVSPSQPVLDLPGLAVCVGVATGALVTGAVVGVHALYPALRQSLRQAAPGE